MLKHSIRIRTWILVVGIMASVSVTALLILKSDRVSAGGLPPSADNSAADGNSGIPCVNLTASQLNSIRIGPVATYEFPRYKETVGTISFADDCAPRAQRGPKRASKCVTA
jgi:hypothetical protein